MTHTEIMFHQERCTDPKNCALCALRGALDSIHAAQGYMTQAVQLGAEPGVAQLRSRVHMWCDEMKRLADNAYGDWLKQFRVGLSRSAVAKANAENAQPFPNGRWTPKTKVNVI